MFSSGPDAVEFAADHGLVMDEWQAICLDIILKEKADGTWAAREAAYVVARQNGKGGILSALSLAALFLFDDVHEILFSAHEFKTAKKAYRDIKGLIEGSPKLHALVERRGSRVVGFRQSNEDTSITLGDGTVLRFMARSSNTGRGFSPQLVIADEAQECSQETRSALFYTIRAQPNPLVVWCGTKPTAKNQGGVFTALRNIGRKGGSRSVSWAEWTPDPNADPMDDQTIIDATPALGYRVTLETVQDERQAALDSGDQEAWQGFLDEALSIWPDEGEAPPPWLVWTQAQWGACADEDAPVKGWLTGPVYLGIEMTPDRARTTIGAAGDCAKGEGIDVLATHHNENGTGWVIDKTVDLCRGGQVERVVIDAGSPAGSLIEPLREAFTEAGIKTEITECTAADLARMTGDTYDAVLAQALWHRSSPEMDEAVGHAAKRNYGSGGSWLLDRRNGVDITPITAPILARYGHSLGPANTLVDLSTQVF